ncbi:hypothetical protein, partial [Roseibium sp.]|uniref:hypothetical protein n=1 Tax=Roseibium sp. TaxID=1936156 RepID=UPI003A974705
AGLLQHQNSESKKTGKRQGFVSSLKARIFRAFFMAEWSNLPENPANRFLYFLCRQEKYYELALSGQKFPACRFPACGPSGKRAHKTSANDRRKPCLIG